MSSVSGTLPVKRRIAPQLLVLLAALAFIGAIWSYMALHNSTQQTLDQHVQSIASQLKCPICQGESVAESQSSLAQEMRGVIRQKIQQGQSDQQIIQFFSDRYGTQIVWSPPLSGFGVLAWLVPIMLLLIGIGIVAMTLQNWREASPEMPNSGRASTISTITGDEDVDEMDENEIVRYRAQLERELSEDDILFLNDDMHPNYASTNDNSQEEEASR
jgi:cytochrome c-type biogenesis protein CcmH